MAEGEPRLESLTIYLAKEGCEKPADAIEGRVPGDGVGAVGNWPDAAIATNLAVAGRKRCADRTF
jgi:hypothetical protein